MAEQARSKNRQGKKRPVKYFYLNDDLHCSLFINRAKDLIIAWNYPEGKKVTYTYSDAIRRRRPAFRTAEVCQLINRSRLTIEKAIASNSIEAPQFTYGLNEHRRKFQYMWREEDVLDLHTYLASLHRGRPRNDGMQANTDLPSPRELRAMMNNEQILYVRQGDLFIPSWKAKDI